MGFLSKSIQMCALIITAGRHNWRLKRSPGKRCDIPVSVHKQVKRALVLLVNGICKSNSFLYLGFKLLPSYYFCVNRNWLLVVASLKENNKIRRKKENTDK